MFLQQKNPEIKFNKIVKNISSDIIDKLAKYENRKLIINMLKQDNINLTENEYQRLVNMILRKNGDKKHAYFYGDDKDEKITNKDIDVIENIISVADLI